MLKPSPRKTLFGFVLLFSLVLPETAYYITVCKNLSASPPSADMVLVYSGGDDRILFAEHWEDAKTLFLFSGWDYTRERLEKRLELGNRMMVEGKARTTDQNARYCAPLVRQAGVHNIVLALPWYHLPRALFLTRYYLMGSGITVTPYATTPLPPGWFLKPHFWEELAKFWGSLFRIGLSWVGIENWPRPTGGA